MPQRFARVESVMDPLALPVAAEYAQALGRIVPRDDRAEELAAELQEIVRLMDGIDGCRCLLEHALLGTAAREELLRRVFEGRVSEVTEGLLMVLGRNGRLRLLPLVAGEFRRLLDARQGKVEVVVTTAVELGESLRRAVAESLRGALGAEPILYLRVDGTILGGMVVRVGDRVYDDSVASRLERIRRALLAGAALRG